MSLWVLVLIILIIVWFSHYTNQSVQLFQSVRPLTPRHVSIHYTTPHVLAQIRSTLIFVDRILKKHHINYFIFCGTLLGAIRHHDVIPWDDDGDVVILRPDIKRIYQMKSDLVASGYGMAVWWGGFKIFPLDGTPIKSNPRLSTPHLFPSVDILIMENTPQHILRYVNHSGQRLWPTEWIKQSELYPLKPYKFSDFELVGPHNPIPYLDRTYRLNGRDWRTTATKTYDHATQSHIKFPIWSLE